MRRALRCFDRIQALLWSRLPDGAEEGATFQFSLVMSAMNLVLGLYTLRSQARDLPGIGWLKPVFLTSDDRRST